MNNNFNDIKKHNEMRRLHISSNFIDNDLEKGKELPIGTERTHGGKQVVKTAKGWVPKKGDGKSSDDGFSDLSNSELQQLINNLSSNTPGVSKDDRKLSAAKKEMTKRASKLKQLTQDGDKPEVLDVVGKIVPFKSGDRVDFKSSHSGRMRGTFVEVSEDSNYLNIRLGSNGPIATIHRNKIKFPDKIRKAIEIMDDYLEKGGKRATIGEIRTFGGRDYIKTTAGWKFHGKGTGAKEHQKQASKVSQMGKKEREEALPKPKRGDKFEVKKLENGKFGLIERETGFLMDSSSSKSKMINDMQSMNEKSKESSEKKLETLTTLKEQLADEEKYVKETQEHAARFGGGERTRYALEQRGEKIKNLKKQIEDIEFPAKKLSTKEITLNKIASTNGQFLRKQDLDITSKSVLQKMLNKVKEIEEELERKDPDLYSDDRGGGPAWFYHIENTLRQAIKNKN